jgi:hypothetical protein
MKAMRWLHRMYLDYPSDALIDAVATALNFGLRDLDRIERMVLERIAGDIFQLPLDDQDKDTDDGCIRRPPRAPRDPGFGPTGADLAYL